MSNTQGPGPLPEPRTAPSAASLATDGAAVTELVDLAELIQDPANARRHGERNLATIEASLKEVGAARSIVIDEAGIIRAGNATAQAAARAGMRRVLIVDTDGQTLVAVRRSGLTEVELTRLALADNRAAELAEGWDQTVLENLTSAGVSLEGLWSVDELAALLTPAPEGGPARPSLVERFGVPPFSVLDARQGYWQDRKRAWLALGIESELGRGDGAMALDTSQTVQRLKPSADASSKKARRRSSSPGGSPRPAMQTKGGKTQRGDGRGRALKS